TEQLAGMVLHCTRNEGVIGVNAWSRSRLAVGRAGIGRQRVIVGGADDLRGQDGTVTPLEELERVIGVGRYTAVGGGWAVFGPDNKPVTTIGAYAATPVVVERVSPEDRAGLVGSIRHVIGLKRVIQGPVVIEPGEVPIAVSAAAIEGVFRENVNHISGE